MSRLKDESVKKCFDLLREFIDEPSMGDSKRGIAVLALNHLQKITAGASLDDPASGGDASLGQDPNCVELPRIDGSPLPV